MTINEDQKIFFSAERLFPAAARRAKILETLQRNWASVVGFAVAQHSRPCNLGPDELTIFSDSQHSSFILSKSKGNIQRVLRKFQLGNEEDFKLKVTYSWPGRQARKIFYVPSPPKIIRVDEALVKKSMLGAPATLPEEINYALSHLKIFLDELNKSRSKV